MSKKIVTFVFSVFLLFNPLEAYKYDLSFCLIFQNEAPYLKEWIEFHRLVGGQHFYLYNNLSTDNYQEVLAPYIQEGIVELFDSPYPSSTINEFMDLQVVIYQDAVDRSKGKTKWLAIIDSDEFIFPVKTDSLVKFLSKYWDKENIGGICANWVIYGTSNVAKIPDDKLMIETLILSHGKGDPKFKSIVKPDKVLAVRTPHYCTYKEGVHHCTPSKKQKRPPFCEIDKIRINHYWTRDEWYLYNQKIPRRELWGTLPVTSQHWGQLGNAQIDTSIFRFIESLRKRVFK